MSQPSFVGRAEAIRHLIATLRGEARAPGKLSILSVEGPGGIGKTCLFDHVMQSHDFSPRNYLTLRVDGGSGDHTTQLFSGAHRMLNAASGRKIADKPPGYYFTHTKQLLARIESLKLAALREVQRHFPADPEVVAIFRRLLDVAFTMGKTLNELIPHTKQYLDVKQLEKWVTLKLEDRAERLDSMQPQSRWLDGILPDWFGVTDANALKANAPKELAAALVANLSALLRGWRSRDWRRPLPDRLPGVDRLLLVIDDYEGLVGHWGEFLVAHLLPALRSARFESVVVILGRDQLENTHPNWDQHLRGCLLDRIVLTPFSEEEVGSLLRSVGVCERAEAERAWRDTLGYPFYLQLWLEESRAGGRTFTMLKRFFDRTTRWMNEQEKDWLELVVFLDRVNKSTLRRLFSEEQEIQEVYTWFEREGSIREVTGEHPCVREYVRSRLAEYFHQRDPDRCQELMRQLGQRRPSRKAEVPEGTVIDKKKLRSPP